MAGSFMRKVAASTRRDAAARRNLPFSRRRGAIAPSLCACPVCMAGLLRCNLRRQMPQCGAGSPVQ